MTPTRFLRERKSLFQTCGRAAPVRREGHHVRGSGHRVDARSARRDRARREVQQAFNAEHGIEPRNTTAALTPIEVERDEGTRRGRGDRGAREELPVGMVEAPVESLTLPELCARMEQLSAQMRAHAAALRFEEAAGLRDELRVLEARKLALGA